jgi:hypothetical protein
MSNARRFLGAGVVTALALSLAVRSSAQLTDDQRKCSDKVNNDSRKILDQEAKYDLKTCVEGGAGGDISPCVSTEAPNAATKRATLVSDFNDACASLPPFGVIGPPDAIADAAESLADTIVQQIFGNPPDGVVAADKCHQKVVQRAEQQAVAAWKGFRNCLHQATSVVNNGTFQACILSGISDGFDKKQGKLDKDVAKNCATIPPPGMEDGDCGAQVTAAGFSACVGIRLDCAFCLATNTITGAGADCDMLDDNVMNGSCP